MIGLTGGIGSGKSTVAALLADYGYPVVDADQLAREIVEPGQPALSDLVEAFGPEILQEDGSLHRAELASRAFVDPQRTQLLNNITHPRIRQLREARFAAAEAAGAKAVIYDMPLLVDQGAHHDMDLTVVVDVDVEERVRRLVTSRGLAEADARRRIAAQISDGQRLAAADVVIDNNGPVSALPEQVQRLVERIQAR